MVQDLPYNMMKLAEEKVKERITRDGSLEEIVGNIAQERIKAQYPYDPSKHIDPTIMDGMRKTVMGEFSAGARENPLQEARDMGLTREVTHEKMVQDTLKTQMGALKTVEGARVGIAGLDINKLGLAELGPALKTFVDDLRRQSRVLQLQGASNQQQGLNKVERYVTSNAGFSIDDHRKELLNRQINKLQLSEQDKSFAGPSYEHPMVESVKNQHMRETVESSLGMGPTPPPVEKRISGANLTDSDESWKNADKNTKERILLNTFKTEMKNMGESESYLQAKLQGGTPFEKHVAKKYIEENKLATDMASNTYGDVHGRGAEPDDLNQIKLGKIQISQATALQESSNEISGHANKLFSMETEEATKNLGEFNNIIKNLSSTQSASASNLANILQGGGGGGKLRGGGGGGHEFGDDPMTFKKLAFTSMDNVIGSLSYPLMDQALMKPMMAGMASSEIMPGFVSSASGAERIFEKVSGYLPRMGEDIKELEMKQKSLKAVTGSYTASDQMIAHATEIAKAEPIQFGTAVQAFTSFSAFPGTREEVKGSQQFRENLTDVIQRLAVLVPEQGEQGASFALREIMSGQYKSLKQRFNMDLPQLTKASGESNMSQSKFETLSGSRQIEILQKGLRVMTGESALAERSLTTGVQTEDLGDALMQSLSLRFVQPQGSTPLGMSKTEEGRMREVFYEQNKRTMGTRLTDQQLRDRTSIQLETAQRSPVGAMAVGIQGMVDALQTGLDSKGIGSSIEKSITSNIFKPFMDTTVSSQGLGGIKDGGDRLGEAIDVLAKGIKQAAKDLTGNNEIQGLMRKGIDAMVGTMTSTLAPGLGYGMAAGAAGSWSALMNPSTVKTIIGGVASTATASGTSWGDSLSVAAPLGILAMTMGGTVMNKMGFAKEDEYKAYKLKLETNEKNLSEGKATLPVTASERTRGLGSKLSAISPDASIRAAMSAAVIGGGIQGITSDDNSIMTKLTSYAMVGGGLASLATSFGGDDLRLGDMFSRGQKGDNAFLRKGMIGPGMIAGVGAITMGTQWLDERSRIKELNRGQYLFDSQYSDLDAIDPELYKKLNESREATKSHGWGGLVGGLIGGAIGGIGGAFGGAGVASIPGAAMGATMGFGVGAAVGSGVDGWLSGNRKEEYDKRKDEADSVITYSGRLDKIKESFSMKNLAQTGDTARFARDLKTSYDAEKGSFENTAYGKMLKLESQQKLTEAGVDTENYEGWITGLGIDKGTPESVYEKFKEGDKETITKSQAADKVMKYERGFTGLISDKTNQDLLAGLTKEDLKSLQTASTVDGRQDFSEKSNWKGAAGSVAETLKLKGIDASTDALERLMKVIVNLGKEAGEIKEGKNGRERTDEVIDTALTANNVLQKIRKEQDTVAMDAISNKKASFFLTGNDAPPNYFSRAANDQDGDTLYEKKMKEEWTPEEYQARTGGVAKIAFLTKTGQEMKAAEEQYNQQLDYAQKERLSGSGYFVGYTPDVVKEINSGLQGGLIDMYAASGDVGAQELQLIRKEKEMQLQKKMDDHTVKGKNLDVDGIRRLLDSMKPLGANQKQKKEALGLINRGLAGGYADPEAQLEWMMGEPGSSPGKIIGGAGRKNASTGDDESEVMEMPDGTTTSVGKISAEEKKWLEAQGGRVSRKKGKKPKDRDKARIWDVMMEADAGSKLRDTNFVELKSQNPSYKTPEQLYAESSDRFDTDSKDDLREKTQTIPEKDRLRSIVREGTVVDFDDADTYKVAGKRGVATVRLANKAKEYETDPISGIKRKVIKPFVDSPETYPKYKGKESLSLGYQSGDRDLEYLGVDISKVNTRSLAEGPLEDSREYLAAVLKTKVGSDKDKETALYRVMSRVDEGRIINKGATGRFKPSLDESGRFTYNRAIGYLGDPSVGSLKDPSSGEDLADSLLATPEAGSSEAARKLHQFKKGYDYSVSKDVKYLEKNNRYMELSYLDRTSPNSTIDDKLKDTNEKKIQKSNYSFDLYEEKKQEMNLLRNETLKTSLLKDPSIRPLFEKEGSLDIDNNKYYNFIRDYEQLPEPTSVTRQRSSYDKTGNLKITPEKRIIKNPQAELVGSLYKDSKLAKSGEELKPKDASKITERIEDYMKEAASAFPAPVLPDDSLVGYGGDEKDIPGYPYPEKFQTPIFKGIPLKGLDGWKPESIHKKSEFLPDWMGQESLSKEYEPAERDPKKIESWWDEKGQARMTAERASEIDVSEKIGIRGQNAAGVDNAT